MLVEEWKRLGIGHRAAKLERAGHRPDLPQLLDGIDGNDRGNGLAALADAQSQIGTAGKQERIREPRPRSEQLVKRARSHKNLLSWSIFFAYRQPRERVCGHWFLGHETVSRTRGNAPARLDDGTVPRAAAEIACKRLMNDGLLRGLSAVMKGKHRHDETRRAEAALGGVGVDHRPLHGMKLPGRAGEPLDCQDSAM